MIDHKKIREEMYERFSKTFEKLHLSEKNDPVDPNIKLDVIKQAYGWTISNDGEVLALVAGDEGYERTGIKIHIQHLKLWACYNYRPENDDI